jgi:hypothetical protein
MTLRKKSSYDPLPPFADGMNSIYWRWMVLKILDILFSNFGLSKEKTPPSSSTLSGLNSAVSSILWDDGFGMQIINWTKLP